MDTCTFILHMRSTSWGRCWVGARTARMGRVLCLGAALALVLLTVGLGFGLGERPSTVQAAGPILVNSLADVTADDGQCTLREAITAAETNTASGTQPGECAAGSSSPDTIAFSV